MKDGMLINPVRAVELFHALADQTRLQILDELKGGERCVCELMDCLEAGQSRLSFHLKVLKDAGMIVDRREGRWMYYAVNTEAFAELDALVDSFTHTKRTSRAPTRC
ncbi:MAG: winged helix-turn-helix transcriptional regulator [Nitrospira sp.]|nr:winged helix-turn-helix transcriptional regulator [Nitrospira sp.]